MKKSSAGTGRTGRWSGFTAEERALIADALSTKVLDMRQRSDADERHAEPARYAAHIATIGRLEELGRQASS